MRLVVALGLAALVIGAGTAAGRAWAAGPYVRPGVPVPSRAPAADDSVSPGSAGAGTAAGAAAQPPASPPGGAPKRDLSATSLSMSGKRAFDMARAADDGAGDALDEGEQAFARIKDLDPDDRGPEALRTIVESGAAARAALVAYRRQAQTSAGEALQNLTRALEISSQANPDPFRRDSLEQQALLAAYEAAVMAARARTEAERLRALLAEGRALVAGVPLKPGGPVAGAGPRPASGAPGQASGQGLAGSAGAGGVASKAAASGGATSAPASKAAAAGSAASATAGAVEVPNVVGARLEAASRDLAAAGLRVGSTTGPRDGHVVKQTPDAGTRVGARSAITLTLSGSAATTVEIAPK